MNVAEHSSRFRWICRAAVITTMVSAVRAQEESRTIDFGWQPGDRAIVSVENERDGGSMTLSYVWTVRAGEIDDTLTITRSETRLTHKDGQAIDEAARERNPQLPATELQADLVPSITVRGDGRMLTAEKRESYLARCRQMIAAHVAKGVVPKSVADGLLEFVGEERTYRAACIEVEKEWNLQVERWLQFDFREERKGRFAGEIELFHGDVVDGNFEVEHLGATEPEGHIAIRLDFAASGPRLDTAALRWRQRMFDRADDTFEPVSLAVAEKVRLVTQPSTMRMHTLETVRVTTVTVSGEPKEFRERRSWGYRWE